MTVSNTSSSTTVTCNGSQTVFNYNFYIPTGGTYWQLQQIDLSGNVTTIPTSAYLVNNVGSTTGGTFTYPLTGSPVAAGYQLTLSRALPYVQSTSLANQGNYYPAVVEAALDWIVLLLQQFLTGSTTAALQQQLSNEIAARIAAVAAITNSIGQPNGIAGLNSLGRLGDISTAQAKLPGTTTEIFIGAAIGGVATPLMFGAVMDGVTDDIGALNALTAYVTANAAPNTFFRIDFNGLNCAVSQPWAPPSNCAISNGGLIALAGANWNTGTGLLQTTAGQYSVSVSNFYLVGSQVSGVQLWYNTSVSNIAAYNVQGRHWGAGGNGFVCNGGKWQLISCTVQQWVTSDPQYTVAADRSGFALQFYNTCADSTVIGGNYAIAAACLDIDETCHHLRFIGVHFYNGGGGVPIVNSTLGSIRGYAIYFGAGYYDSGFWLLQVDSSSHQTSPSIIFDGGTLLYNSANATFAAWFQVTTSQANTDLSAFGLKNLWARTSGGIPLMSFATTGGGSYAATVPTAYLATVTSDLELTGNTVTFGASLTFGGVNGLIGNLLNVVPLSAGGRTSLQTDSGGVIAANSAGEPVTLDPNATVGTGFWVSSVAAAGNTVTAGTGATLNGVAGGSLTVGYRQSVFFLCIANGGSAAAWSSTGQTAQAIRTARQVAGTTDTITINDDSNYVNYQNGSSAVAVALPANTGLMSTTLAVEGTGVVTFTAAAGAYLNGVAAGSATVNSNTSYALTCQRNPGAAARWYLK